MATHDYVIANGTGAAVRSDLNDALAAIVSNNSGSSEPATTYAYQWWADTTANVLKIRNSANNAWITLRELDGTLLMEDGSLAAPGLAFASDLDTGFSRSAANKINFSTGGAERLEIGDSEVVFNDPSNDVDLRVESNGNTHMLFVDAGNDRIGIAENSPSSLLSLGTSLSDFKLKLYDGGDANDYGFGVQSGVLNYHSGGAHVFEKGGSEKARIDSSGRLLVGTSSSVGPDNFLQLVGDVNDEASITCWRSSDDAGSGGLNFIKTRGSVSSPAVASNNDGLGIIRWHAYDGSTFDGRAAQIEAQVDGGVAAGDTPGRLVFSTCADGASSATERLRIDSSGRVGIGTTATQQVLTIDVNDSGTDQGSFNGINIANTNTTANNGSAITFGQTVPGNSNARIGVIQTARGPSESQEMFFGLLGSGAYSEVMRLDSSGRLLVGTSSDTTGDTGAKVQIVDTGTPVLALSRNDTSIVSGNTIGQIRIFSNDDSGYQECAKIAAQADGTFANNDKPTRLVFSTTASSGSSPTERMRIDSSGRLLVGTTSAVDSGATSSLQVVNTSTAIIALGRNDSSISAGNDLGAIRFYGNDGGSYQECAEIVAEADGDHANNDKPSRLVFSTTAGGASSSSERMRITSSGDVCINRTAPVESEKFSVQNGSNVAFFNCTTNSNVALMMLKHAYAQGSQTATQIQFRNDSNSTVGSITSTNSATAYNTSSDYRLKENVVDLDGAIARVKQLLPKRFNFIVNPETTVDGFLAHEAATVVPEAVTGTHNEVNSDNNPVYQGIDQSKLVPLLTAALQEAIAKIETLETKVAALEAG